MQIADHIRDFGQWVKPYLTETKVPQTTRRVSIGLTDKKISLIHLDQADLEVNLLFAQSLAYEEIETVPLVLSGIVQKHGLAETPTCLLLPPNDYQLFLIDSMPVNQNEMRDAVNWRVRSLISYPPEEAVMDYFMLPPKKTAGSSPMVAAVVARHNRLASLIDLFKKSGFMINGIDIPELAMKNLTSRYEHDEKSTAYIYFYDNSAILNITCQQYLYFTRRINLPASSEYSLKEIEDFCLELLRYFDYFQSQWRYPSPTRIFVTAENKNANDIAQLLSQHLLVTVEPYALASFPTNAETTHYLEKNCLLTLGCALREESTNATSRN